MGHSGRRSTEPPGASTGTRVGERTERRAAELRDKGVVALKRHLENAKGRRINVLMENEVQGRAADFTPVRFDACAAGAGALIDAVVSGDDGATLLAETAP